MPGEAALRQVDLAPAPIEFCDLAAQRRHLGTKLDAAIMRVVEHGKFILGPEVEQLEKKLGAFCGATHVITCDNGTNALLLGLMALGVRPGDAVFVPSFTFCATAEAVAQIGATPVFIDVTPETFTLCPTSLEAGLVAAKKAGLKPVGVIPVDLFGHPADYRDIMLIAQMNKIWIMCDAAQSFGAVYCGRKVGKIGTLSTTSFFPAKPLGCYGDGGAVFTEDAELAKALRSLRFHGKGDHKYDNVRIGLNSRLDTMQAAILLEKLAIFADEILARNAVAARYHAGLKDHAITPIVRPECTSTWAQYTLRLPHHDRDAVAEELRRAGVPTAVYYPKPLHQQTAYKGFPVALRGLPVSEKMAKEVLSLPMHPYLDPVTQDRIIDAVRAALI
ncbi:MAG: DegT/DnrJ/EryC1/StrS aminotransferase family protein [Alphaproteobacteria bacterium]